MKSDIDYKNKAILDKSQELFDQHTDIRVGDFVYYGKNRMKRVAHIHAPDEIQLTNNGSYYFSNGFCEMSGGLDSTSKGEFIPTEETKEGDVWFFSHDQVQAHNAIYCKAQFRVFRFKGLIEPPRAFHLTIYNTITNEMRDRYGIDKPYLVERHMHPRLSFLTKEQLQSWMKDNNLVVSAHCCEHNNYKSYSLDCDNDMEISLATLATHEAGLRLEAFQDSHFDDWELYNSEIRARKALLHL